MQRTKIKESLGAGVSKSQSKRTQTFSVLDDVTAVQ